MPAQSVKSYTQSNETDDFTATHWSQVALAGQSANPVANREALETLCARYWPAIHAFLRRKNYDAATAEDLTQGFFSQLLEDNAIGRADQSRGRFRNFLLGALQRYLADEFRKAGAQKRGRGKIVLALDFTAIEERYAEAADPGLTAQQLYDQHWAAGILECAFSQLRSEFWAANQAARFDCLKRYLADEARPGEYEEIASGLGIGVKAVSSAVCRMRERYRQLVRRQVLATVGSPAEAEAELRDLFG